MNMSFKKHLKFYLNAFISNWKITVLGYFVGSCDLST